MDNKIWFNTYIHNGYEVLSNFANTPFVVDGVEYRTNEHFYQSQKFARSDNKYAKFVNAAKTPGGAKERGSDRTHQIDENWENIKLEIMMTGLRAKFTIPKNREVLLGSGNSELIESSYKDRFWGRHPSGVGANNLGILLMKLRDEINNENE